MAKPSGEELAFVKRHGIPLSQVFDATGMPNERYKKLMRELGMVVAIGVTPCALVRHTLRTRYGHCVQCGTHNLAFLKRFDEAGDVYVARSKSSALTKIGTANDAAERARSLNNFGYGGSNDWNIKFVRRCDKAGRVEVIAHQALERFSASRAYEEQ